MGVGQDSAFPFLAINGKEMDSRITKIVIHTDNDYEVSFTGNDVSTFQNGEVEVYCPTLFDWGINIIRYMAENNMSLNIDIQMKNGKEIQANLVRNTFSDVNQAQIMLDVLQECNYLDENYSIQADIVVYFSEIEKNYKSQIKVINLNNKKSKSYSEFGERYGITLTTDGSTGVDGKLPWFKVNVKNTDKSKMIDGFDIVYYGTTVYGKTIELDSDGAKLLHQTIVKNIKPGKSYTSDKLNFYKTIQPKTIYAAIRRLHFDDGLTVEIPLRDLLFFSYKIDY